MLESHAPTSEKIVIKPLNQTSAGINTLQEKIRTEKPVETDKDPEQASKKMAKMKAGTARKNDDLAVSPDAQHTQISHSAPVTTSQSARRIQAVPAML